MSYYYFDVDIYYVRERERIENLKRERKRIEALKRRFMSVNIELELRKKRFQVCSEKIKEMYEYILCRQNIDYAVDMLNEVNVDVENLRNDIDRIPRVIDFEQVEVLEHHVMMLDGKLAKIEENICKVNNKLIASEIRAEIGNITLDREQEVVSERVKVLREEIEYRIDSINSARLSAELISECESFKAEVMNEKSSEMLAIAKKYRLSSLERRCNNYYQLKSEYDELAVECSVLADMLEEGIVELPEISPSGINKLKKIKQELEKKVEQDYIRRCFEEIMDELELEKIGERIIRKKDGDRISSHLYQFSEGTAVKITYDNLSNVSIELGGVGISDRATNSEEADNIVQECKKLNELYKSKIKSRINSKCKNINVIEKCYKAEDTFIINISEYNMYRKVKCIEEISVCDMNGKCHWKYDDEGKSCKSKKGV